jgi:signal transduction histidine kinase
MPDVLPDLHALRLQALGRLAATLAHDLREPVASIQQTADYLATRIEEVPRPFVELQLRDIAASCRDLLGVIDGALDYGRRARARLAPLSLCELIDDTGSLLRHQLRDGGHMLRWRIVDDAEWVLGDRRLLQQTLVNLLTNACATRDGCTICITTTRLAAGEAPARGDHRMERVSARITDDGPGVPTELVDRIFEPFFTTRTDGTGLGLGTSREAVLALGGTLTCEPSERGACFVLTLPAAPTAAPERDAGLYWSNKIEVSE